MHHSLNIQWCNLTLARRFWASKVKLPKYVCLVAQLGEQLFGKQILKIVLDIL